MLLLFLAQAVQTPAQLAERFAAMTAVSGYEQAMADSITALVPGAIRDRAGSAVVGLGPTGPPMLIDVPPHGCEVWCGVLSCIQPRSR